MDDSQDTITCAKCGHVRRTNDELDLWRCPACAVVYAKIGQSLTRRAPARSVGALNVPFTGARWQWVLVAGVVAFAVLVGLWSASASNGVAASSTDTRTAWTAQQAAREAERAMFAQDVATLRPLMATWEDETAMAASTPRIMLASHISRLDGVLDEVRSTRMHSECTRHARDVLVHGMGARRAAFARFYQTLSAAGANASADDAEREFMRNFAACKPSTSS